jgi:acetolactate synthase regulatory subunit
MRSTLVAVFLTVLIWWGGFSVFVVAAKHEQDAAMSRFQMELAKSRVAILSVVDDRGFALSSMMEGQAEDLEKHWIGVIKLDDEERSLDLIFGQPSNPKVIIDTENLLKGQTVVLGSKMINASMLVAFSKSKDDYVVLGRHVESQGYSRELILRAFLIAGISGLLSMLMAFVATKFLFPTKPDVVKSDRDQ